MIFKKRRPRPGVELDAGAATRHRARSRARQAVMTLLLVGLPAGVEAASFRGGGVWAGRPQVASYTPRAHEAFNTAGGAVQIRRTSAGNYGVFFGGLALSNVGIQVSAAGPHGDRCQAALRRVTRGGLEVTVACRDASGKSVDSAFSLLAVSQQGNDAPLGYLSADQRSSPGYSPAAGKAFSSAGTAAKVGRSAPGRYAVAFPGLSISGGSVQVVAEGLVRAHCKVIGWRAAGANVACFDDAGLPRDAAFSLMMLDARSLGGGASFVWANKATAARYQASGAYAHNAAGGAIPIERLSAGTYSVRFEGLGEPGGVAVVTGYGAGAIECNLGGLAPDPAAQRITVHCFDSDGIPRDGRFSLTYVRGFSGGAGPRADSPVIPGGKNFNSKQKKATPNVPSPSQPQLPDRPIGSKVLGSEVLMKVLARDLTISLLVRDLTVDLVADTRRSGEIELDSIRWTCSKRRCQGQSHLDPTVDLCKSLARQVGRVASFSNSNRSLDAGQINSCNQVLVLSQYQIAIATALRPMITLAPGSDNEKLEGKPGPLPVPLPLYEGQLDRIPQILDDFASGGGWDYFIYPDGKDETKYYYVPREYRIALAEGSDGTLALTFNFLSATEDGQDVLMTAKLRPPNVVGDFSLLQRLTAETVGLDRRRLELLPFPIESAEVDIAEALADFGIDADRVRVRAPSNVLEPIDLSIALDERALQNLISQMRTEFGLGGTIKLRSGDVIATVPVTLSFANFSGAGVTDWAEAKESNAIENHSPFPVSVRGMVAYVDAGQGGIRRQTWAFDRPIEVAPVDRFEMPGLAFAFRDASVVHAWMDYDFDADCNDCLDSIEDRATTQTGLLRRDELTIEALSSVFSGLDVVKLVVELEGAAFSPDGGISAKSVALYEDEARLTLPVWLDRSQDAGEETARFRVQPITSERSWGFSEWRSVTGMDITLTPFELRALIQAPDEPEGGGD